MYSPETTPAQVTKPVPGQVAKLELYFWRDIRAHLEMDVPTQFMLQVQQKSILTLEDKGIPLFSLILVQGKHFFMISSLYLR